MTQPNAAVKVPISLISFELYGALGLSVAVFGGMLLCMQQLGQQEATPYITLALASELLHLGLSEVEALADSGHLDTFVDDDGAVYVSHVSVIHVGAANFRAQLRAEGI